MQQDKGQCFSPCYLWFLFYLHPATRPLLRQIENLNSTYTAQSATYEKVERNLTERLAEAQNAQAAATEKERAATEQLMEQTTRITTIESQLSGLRQEKSRLTAQLEMERSKSEVLEDAKNKWGLVGLGGMISIR